MNCMRIIVVKGAPNTGKTTAIRLAYDIALYLGAAVIVSRNAKSKPHADFDTVLLYQGRRIGFHTAGDLRRTLTDIVSKHSNCDTLVMASRNFDKTKLDSIFSGHNVVFLHKTMADDIENVDIARNIVVNL